MLTLNSDIFYAFVTEVSLQGPEDVSKSTLLSLSQTCRSVRDVCLPILFAEVHWPHQNKNDPQSGLHFFPESLFQYFRRFRLAWPEVWPDASPPRFGDKAGPEGDYIPRHVDKLVAAIPFMSSLSAFYITCPFYPPHSLLTALARNPFLISLDIHDTPLHTTIMPDIPFRLKRVSLVPVGEAVRAGEGPYEHKYSDVKYFLQVWRRKYTRNMERLLQGRYAASLFVTQLGKYSPQLRHLEVSGSLCGLEELASHDWPNLHTLVLTGHSRPAFTVHIVDVLAKMGELRELRLLFARTKDEKFHTIPPGGSISDKGTRPSVWSSLKSLALSNQCDFEGLFQYTTSLERLALSAIVDLPRLPIALSRSDTDQVVKDLTLNGSGGRLRHFRIMIEDKVNPELCNAIAATCPELEILEIELCSYHDGKSVFEWTKFADAFASLTKIRHLRLCIQFPEYDDTDDSDPWRTIRRECALYLAQRMPSLERIGFEYRKRTGTHRYEDNWLEFDIERDKRDGAVDLFELRPSWYPFPDVWHPVPLEA